MGKWGNRISNLSILALSFTSGWLGFSYINRVSDQIGGGVLWILGILFTVLVAIVLGYIFHVIIHEAGHLAGGLLTGWGFVNFAVFGHALVKEDGKLRRKKFHAQGSAGSCALTPPEMREDTFPHKLYFSGGFIGNFLFSALCFFLFFHFASSIAFLSRGFFVIGIFGMFMGLQNLIPNKGDLPNDGYFLLRLGNKKNVAMRRAFWVKMRAQALEAKGVRPRDFPAEWIQLVHIDDVNDLYTLAAATLQYDYYMDRGELEKARTFMQALCEKPNQLPETYKLALNCALLFHELIHECREEEVDRLYTEALKNYIEAANMHRLSYAYARLVSNDVKKAAEQLDLFQKACEVSTMPGGIPSEQAQIALVDTIADKREKERVK